MTLSKEQIDQLFLFTEKKLVRYYDVQVELVDHLAIRIEEELEANQKLKFEDALQKVYAAFGIFGFAKIVQEKEAAVLKTRNVLWRKEFATYFKLPQIIFTLLVFLITFQSSQLFSLTIVNTVLCTCLVSYILYNLYLELRLKKLVNKKLLMLTAPSPVYVQVFIFILQLQISNFSISTSLAFSFACALGFFIITALITVQKKIIQQAKTNFPEAFNLA